MASTTTLIHRASRQGEDRLHAARLLFERLGWKESLGVASSAGTDGCMLDLLSAGEPQAVVVLTASEESTGPFSLGYSREARYVVLWTPTVVTVQDPRRWSEMPGDAPLLDADAGSTVDVRRLLESVTPKELLDDVPGLYASRGRSHEGLADLLGGALAELRRQVADAGLLNGMAPESRDFVVLRLFHQLLFIRFQEDRGARASDVVLSSLNPAEDLREAVAVALEDYRERLNSELFSPLALDVGELPARALSEVIRQMVEPWVDLRLDFSVSRTEIAGRLYQSYLHRLPRREPEKKQTRLFARSHSVDARERAASYYTPPALARYVVEQTLGVWLRRHMPTRPEDVRMVDPACGSGAFLIAAYRTLMRHFADLRGRELRAAEREEILRACVYGSDVDERALGLAQIQLLEEAHVGGKLPALGRNLIQGDALAAPPGERARARQVPWSAVLQELGRGFDVVVGNPPFGSQVKMPRRVDVAELNAVARLYPEVSAFGRDYAYLFVALALRLLRDTGMVGLVLPRTLLDGVSGGPARRLLAERSLRLLVDFRAAQLFDAKAYVCVAVSGCLEDRVEVASVRDSRVDARSVLDQLARRGGHDVAYRKVARRRLLDNVDDGWSAFRLRWDLDLRGELSAEVAPLIPEPGAARVARWGTKPGAIERFLVGSDEWRPAGAGRVAVGESVLPERYIPRLVRSEDITPFHIADSARRLFVPFEDDGKLSTRAQVAAELKRRGGLPTNVQHGDLRTLRGPKLLLRALAREPATVVDLDGSWMPLMGTAGAIAIRMDDVPAEDLVAYEALLNSALHQWLLRGVGRPKHDESIELTTADVERLPVPPLDRGGIARLASAGEAVRSALDEPDPLTRTRRYRDARLALDTLVYELMGASVRLRAVVADELIRTT